jgi:TM2 domain-containing membrane protein YozV
MIFLSKELVGWLGIHRFYIGPFWSGLAMFVLLATMLVSAIKPNPLI